LFFPFFSITFAFSLPVGIILFPSRGLRVEIVDSQVGIYPLLTGLLLQV